MASRWSVVVGLQNRTTLLASCGAFTAMVHPCQCVYLSFLSGEVVSICQEKFGVAHEQQPLFKTLSYIGRAMSVPCACACRHLFVAFGSSTDFLGSC